MKNFLIRSTCGWCVSIAKRTLTPSANFFEMVSDGNMSLFRAVEKFDYTKGNKFSTYATWAIMKNYARSIRPNIPAWTGSAPGMTRCSTTRLTTAAETLRESDQPAAAPVIMSILDQLEDRERKIIIQRYGLDDGDRAADPRRSRQPPRSDQGTHSPDRNAGSPKDPQDRQRRAPRDPRRVTPLGSGASSPRPSQKSR